MATPLSKYKVTFTGPRYAVGEDVVVRWDKRKITASYCEFRVIEDGDGKRLFQNTWYYDVESNSGFPAETVNEQYLIVMEARDKR